MSATPGPNRTDPSSAVAQLADALVTLAEAQQSTQEKLNQLLTLVNNIASAQAAEAARPRNMRPVVIQGFSMSFPAMVIFMIKWAIASIPAFLMLLTLAWVVVYLLTTVFGFGMRF